MEIKKTTKFVFRMLSIILFSLITSFLLFSTILAKYLTSDSAVDSARVAKWDIDFNNGMTFNSIIASTHLESGSSGTWELDIKNNSEVLAKFSENSNVKIRLQSPDFNVDHEHNHWDFLHDNEHNPIDNPINFEAFMYNCSLAELKALNGDYSSLKVVKLFNTKDDELHFQMVIHNGELYYECVVDFGSELNKTNDFLLEIGEGNACLVLSWKVDNVEGSVDTTDPFKSYHLLTKEEYDANKDKYSGKYNDVVYKIGGKEYVIVYKTRNYFEYLIYTSSLGGEIMITFKDNTGKEYIKRCTKLSDSEKIELNNRNLNNVSTVNDLTRYIEKLENEQYTKFLGVQSEYNELSGYLSLGLECRIVLDLSIEQVD